MKVDDMYHRFIHANALYTSHRQKKNQCYKKRKRQNIHQHYHH